MDKLQEGNGSSTRQISIEDCSRVEFAIRDWAPGLIGFQLDYYSKLRSDPVAPHSGMPEWFF